MRRLRKFTRALPLAILLLGAAVPLAVRPGARADRRAEVQEAHRRAGHTGAEWRGLALEALAEGRHDLALRRIKTAESVDPGRQFAREAREIRSARRIALDVERSRERLLGGRVERIEFDRLGGVVVAYRTTVSMPGESLWSIARRLAAAEDGVPASRLAADDHRVYALWDQLTDLNGLRELKVGEHVKVPLPREERETIASANADDLAKIAEGRGALARGDLETAATLREAVVGPFALSTPEFAAFDEVLANARRETLVAVARRSLGEALALSRASKHGQMVELLSAARDALVEVGGSGGGPEFASELNAIDSLLEQAARYRVLEDGSVVAPKPRGVAYTDAVRTAVEWFLDRKLQASGAEYPYSDRKTPDEIGWAKYLCDASDMARREGVDFAALLESDARNLEVRLPNPEGYFRE
jgi:hypothetical protein